jgi:hypothetical protein
MTAAAVTAGAQMIRNAAHALVRYTPRAVYACLHATCRAGSSLAGTCAAVPAVRRHGACVACRVCVSRWGRASFRTLLRFWRRRGRQRTQKEPDEGQGTAARAQLPDIILPHACALLTMRPCCLYEQSSPPRTDRRVTP